MENFNFETKAKAIWKALDEMAEKDPETYKKFINDQLNGDGMKDMFKQLNLGKESPEAASMTAKKTTKKSTVGSTETKSHGGRQPMSSSSSSSSGPSKKRSLNTLSGMGEPSSMNNDKSNALLDDTFARLKSHSLLAQIVADDEEDEDFLLTDIKLPGLGTEEGNGDGQSKSAKKKVLIEEL